jgi:hypothetical protein
MLQGEIAADGRWFHKLSYLGFSRHALPLHKIVLYLLLNPVNIDYIYIWSPEITSKGQI